MNPDSERVDEALDKTERAGAGILALGELLATAETAFLGENTLSGIGYLLEIIGDQITVDACACREAICGRAASATPPGEVAPP